MNFETEQEKFWAGKFGNEYIQRNKSSEQLASNLNLFLKIFQDQDKPNSLIELGSNIGMNLKAIKLLFPNIEMFGVEINSNAAMELSNFLGHENVYNGSIFDFQITKTFDVSLISGVLIHIEPNFLNNVYEKLYNSTNKYIIISEYYNPTPISIKYRGHDNVLFKRDFAGEIMDKYKDLKLVKYGFCYKRDELFLQDDITWFLLKKN
ncbi:MAG: pseudaminic acid biosynthesis-associated methylase [Candidatus Sericytochromatia bacterium]